jgi:hypothetical protein
MSQCLQRNSCGPAPHRSGRETTPDKARASESLPVLPWWDQVIGEALKMKDLCKEIVREGNAAQLLLGRQLTRASVTSSSYFSL